MAIASRATGRTITDAEPGLGGGRLTRLIEAVPELIAVAAAGFTPAPMLLLLAGSFKPWLAILLGVLGSVAAVAVFLRSCSTGDGSSRAGSRTSLLATGAALAVAGIWLAANLPYSSEDLYAQRDPATYQLTARWLMDHQSLRTIPTHPELFGSLPGIDDSSAGFLNGGPGWVYAQGNHLLPVVLACVGTLLGATAILKAAVVITALALVVFSGAARRVVGGRLAVVAMAALAVSMPVIYVGRDTYSEPLAMLFLMGGLALLHRAIESGRVVDYALAGFVTSCSAVVRIDSYVSLLALLAVALVLPAAARPASRPSAVRRSVALLLGALPMAVLGWLDATRLANGYYHNQRVQIVPLMLAGAASLVVGSAVIWLIWRRDYAAGMRTPTARRRLAGWASAAVVIAFLALVSRPLWLQSHGNRDLDVIRAVQQAAGDAVDGTRTYTEQTLNWQAMYLGWPTVLLAVTGYILLLRALIVRAEWGLLAVLTMGLSVTTLYLVTPEITPDQIWAMRRFVPVVMPTMLIAAAYALRRGYAWLAARHALLSARGLAAVGTVLLVGVPLAVSLPMRTVREQVPHLSQVAALCRAFGDRAAVLAVDDGLRYGYSQTIRSWCGVPAVGLVGASQSDLRTAQTTVQAAGRTLYVMAARPDQGTYAGSAPTASFSSVTVTRWPPTLHAPPKHAVLQTIAVYLSTVDSTGRLVPVAG
jgi:hypothetical protein